MDWFDAETVLDDSELLVGWVDSSEQGLDELTMFPADALDENRVVAWVSAREGSYVNLDEMG